MSLEIKNKIYIGDVLDILKDISDNCIDVSVTSPPYNKQENKKGWLVKNVEYSNSTDAKPEDEYQAEQIEMLNEVIVSPNLVGRSFIIIKLDGKKGC